jgi:hypothetical protein
LFPLLIIAGLVIFFIVPFTQAGSLAQFAIGEFVKGPRVGMHSSPLLDGNGDPTNEIAQNPQDLADSAGLSLDVYTGARVISSEEGNSPVMHQIAVGWATQNNAVNRGASVFEYATDGSFGKQGSGRPVSTWQDPYDGHVKIFQAIVDGQIADPTQGATMWVAPASQTALHLVNPDKYKSFADVNASRLADGYVPVEIPGVNASLLVMYRKA